MGRASEVEYEQWLLDVFVHAYARTVAGEFGDYPADIVERDTPTAFACLSRLFRESSAVVGRYSSEQIGTAFWYLMFSACSEYSFVLTDSSIPIDRRVAAVRSITDVYRDCFRMICTCRLCHLERGTRASWPMDANGMCYMWWDVCPIWCRLLTDAEELDANDPVARASVEALEATLAIDHIACIEGALHGVGHLHAYCPAEAERIIDGFLARRTELPAELLAYAARARNGEVE